MVDMYIMLCLLFNLNINFRFNVEKMYSLFGMQLKYKFQH
jgi:hypothetical protein